MYQCKVVYKLKWKGLGEEAIVIDREKETGQSLFVIAEWSYSYKSKTMNIFLWWF